MENGSRNLPVTKLATASVDRNKFLVNMVCEVLLRLLTNTLESSPQRLMMCNKILWQALKAMGSGRSVEWLSSLTHCGEVGGMGSRGGERETDLCKLIDCRQECLEVRWRV